MYWKRVICTHVLRKYILQYLCRILRQRHILIRICISEALRVFDHFFIGNVYRQNNHSQTRRTTEQKHSVYWKTRAPDIDVWTNEYLALINVSDPSVRYSGWIKYLPCDSTVSSLKLLNSQNRKVNVSENSFRETLRHSSVSALRLVCPAFQTSVRANRNLSNLERFFERCIGYSLAVYRNKM